MSFCAGIPRALAAPSRVRGRPAAAALAAVQCQRSNGFIAATTAGLSNFCSRIGHIVSSTRSKEELCAHRITFGSRSASSRSRGIGSLKKGYQVLIGLSSIAQDHMRMLVRG